jgi:hypothetical protein
MKSPSRWWIVLYVLAVVIVLGRVGNAIGSDHSWRELIRIELPGNGSSVPEWIGYTCEGFLEDYLVFIVIRRLVRKIRNPNPPPPSTLTNDELMSALPTPLPRVSRMPFNILFPFRSKYRELGLSRWWWHRLAIVLFAVALTAELLMGIWVTVEEYSEKNTQLSSVTSDYVDAKAKQIDQNASPDGNQAINQHYEELIKSIKHDADVSLWWDIGGTLGILGVLSYVLQLLYRTVIYVAYGNIREPKPL